MTEPQTIMILMVRLLYLQIGKPPSPVAAATTITADNAVDYNNININNSHNNSNGNSGYNNGEEFNMVSSQDSPYLVQTSLAQIVDKLFVTE
ncbi:hypothetical protein Glove_109g85 [Diversispora epigaea]|uniref:Uncharacterized protein n=1 Tax=Diversispora epigaea TaxID=1348612 RepID=A0A397J538_9GLOM|nr:hypothetical protein Glove_109g85 [Diversispora epigaea]